MNFIGHIGLWGPSSGSLQGAQTGRKETEGISQYTGVLIHGYVGFLGITVGMHFIGN